MKQTDDESCDQRNGDTVVCEQIDDTVKKEIDGDAVKKEIEDDDSPKNKNDKIEKTPPSNKKKSPKKGSTDEGDEYLEEEIIDGFAFISFRTLDDLEAFTKEDEEKKRLAKEAEEAANPTKPEVITPKARKAPRRNKENDSLSTPRIKPADAMGVKRALQQNGTDDGVVARKMLKLEPTDDKEGNELLNASIDNTTKPSTSTSAELLSPVHRQRLTPKSEHPSGENAHPSDPAQTSVITHHSSNRMQQLGMAPNPHFPFLPTNMPTMTSMAPFMASSLPFSIMSPYGPAMMPFSPMTPSVARPPVPTSACLPVKKQGKWCAMHVKIAWDIAKKRFGTQPSSVEKEPTPSPAVSSTGPAQQTSFNHSFTALHAAATSTEPLSLVTPTTAERLRSDQMRLTSSASATPVPTATPDSRTLNGSASGGHQQDRLVDSTVASSSAAYTPAMSMVQAMPPFTFMPPALAQAMMPRPDGFGHMAAPSLENLFAPRVPDLNAALRSAAPTLNLPPTQFSHRMNAPHQMMIDRSAEHWQAELLRRQQTLLMPGLPFAPSEGLQRQMLERDPRHLLAANSMLMQTGIPGHMQPGLLPESLLSRVPPGMAPLPPNMANPYLTANMAKAGMPFSNTLEQLARQKRDLHAAATANSEFKR